MTFALDLCNRPLTLILRPILFQKGKRSIEPLLGLSFASGLSYVIPQSSTTPENKCKVLRNSEICCFFEKFAITFSVLHSFLNEQQIFGFT